MRTKISQLFILLLLMLGVYSSIFYCTDDQFYFNSQCRKCPKNAIPSIDKSTCICKDTNAQFDPINIACLCNPGFFLNIQDQLCQKCSDNCINCDNILECKTCKVGYNIKIETKDGKNSKLCAQICGDGISYKQPCDDNNLIDGDGCSNNCTIEKGWLCKEGPSTTKSICNKEIIFNKTFFVHLETRILQYIKILNLPECVTKNQCNQCFKFLQARTVDNNIPILVKINYIPFSKYRFIIEYDAQGTYITSMIKIHVKFNKQYRECIGDQNYLKELEMLVDFPYPPYPHIIDQDILYPEDIYPPSPSNTKNNKIKIPERILQLIRLDIKSESQLQSQPQPQ